MLNLTRNELLSVSKPARYVGGEYNQVIKDAKSVKCRYAFAFLIYMILVCQILA